ncbi:unnamed protein product [Arabidopsis thaliana]|uniref:(thale cress) hypothetical protein n=1 Tax=Arabidopsis thaliana TaxID=3702 RepID=A0A7G2E5U5_ARATH|nr:unnamed protein product [Arabidopsis thaliana]
MAEITEDPNIVPPVATLTGKAAFLDPVFWDNDLPPWLYGTKRYPDARLNVYSKFDYLYPSDDIVILEWDNVWIRRQSRLLADVHAVEQDRDDDEVRDKKVSYMLEKIQSGYGFAKYEWPGGVMSLDLIDIVKAQSNVEAQLKKVSDRNTLIQNRFRDSRFLHARRRAKPSMFRFKKLVRNSASETTSRFMHARWRAKPTFLRELFGKDNGEQDWTHFEHPLGGLDRNSEPQLSSRLDDIQMEETVESFNTALTEHQSENTDKEVSPDVVPEASEPPLSAQVDKPQEFPSVDINIGLLNDGTLNPEIEFPESDLVMDPFIFPVPYHVSQYQPNGEQVFKTPIHNQDTASPSDGEKEMLKPLVLSDSSPVRLRDLTLLDQEEAGLVSTFINRPPIDIFKILPSKDDPDWPSFQQILSKFPDT